MNGRNWFRGAFVTVGVIFSAWVGASIVDLYTRKVDVFAAEESHQQLREDQRRLQQSINRMNETMKSMAYLACLKAKDQTAEECLGIYAARPKVRIPPVDP